MKRQDPLGMREGGDDLSTVLALICYLLQTVQILQTALQIGQTLAQNRLARLNLQEIKEGNAGEKLGITSGLLRSKIAQQGLQHLDSVVCQCIQMAIGFARLLDNLASHRAHFFKALEDEVERFVVDDNHASQRPVDIFFDLVAMPLSLLQHGKD